MAAVQNADFALNGTHGPLTREPFPSSSKSATYAEEERDPAVTTASEVGDAEHTRPRYFSYMRGPVFRIEAFLIDVEVALQRML